MPKCGIITKRIITEGSLCFVPNAEMNFRTEMLSAVNAALRSALTVKAPYISYVSTAEA